MGGNGIRSNLGLERLGGKPEIEQALSGLVRHFQEPFAVRPDVAGEVSTDRGRLYPGSLGPFKGSLNTRSVGKLTPTHLKSILRHAQKLIVSKPPVYPVECLVSNIAPFR